MGRGMEISVFFARAAGLFTHPFKVMADFYAASQDQARNVNLKLALLSFLTGNSATIIAGMLMDSTGAWGGVGFVLFGIFYQLLAALLFSAVLAAVFYLCLTVFAREGEQNPGMDRLMFLYFISDFLYTGLLPLALLLRTVSPAADFLFGLAGFTFIVINVLLKIRALSLLKSIGGGKSALIFFLPFIVFIAVIALGAVYFMTFVARMFM